LPDIDKFALSLLEESKRFLEKCEDEKDEGGTAYLHAALLLAFCSLEAHVNSVSDDFLQSPDLSAHDQSILEERDVQLVDGEFVLKKNLKMYRLEDRILYLHKRFSGDKFDKGAPWREGLATAINLRNKLTHPKAVPQITKASVERAIEAVMATIDSLYLAVYKRKFPAVGRGLQSHLTF
jgi:hypothetical protein